MVGFESVFYCTHDFFPSRSAENIGTSNNKIKLSNATGTSYQNGLQQEPSPRVYTQTFCQIFID